MRDFLISKLKTLNVKDENKLIEYVDYYDYTRFLESEAVEVFPKEVTAVIYE